MSDDTSTLITAINESPLSPEDKNHWRDLLPRMNESQKERLLHSLTVKTQANKAMQLIKRALEIIDEAEAEAEQETTVEDKKEEIRKQIDNTATTQKPEEKITLKQEDLQKMHEDEQKRLNEMREELRKLSQETHGAEPPSYQQQTSQA